MIASHFKIKYQGPIFLCLLPPLFLPLAACIAAEMMTGLETVEGDRNVIVIFWLWVLFYLIMALALLAAYPFVSPIFAYMAAATAVSARCLMLSNAEKCLEAIVREITE